MRLITLPILVWRLGMGWLALRESVFDGPKLEKVLDIDFVVGPIRVPLPPASIIPFVIILLILVYFHYKFFYNE
jgi:hypothetical protein